MITHLCSKTTSLLQTVFFFLLFMVCSSTTPSIAEQQTVISTEQDNSINLFDAAPKKKKQGRIESFHSSTTKDGQNRTSYTGQTFINRDGSKVTTSNTHSTRTGTGGNTRSNLTTTSKTGIDGRKVTVFNEQKENRSLIDSGSSITTTEKVQNSDKSETSTTTNKSNQKNILSSTQTTGKSSVKKDATGGQTSSSHEISQTIVGDKIITTETKSKSVGHVTDSSESKAGYKTKHTEINGQTSNVSVKVEGETTHKFGKTDDSSEPPAPKNGVNKSITLYDNTTGTDDATYEAKGGTATRISKNVDISGSYSVQAMQTGRSKGTKVTVDPDSGAVKVEHANKVEANLVKVQTGGKLQVKTGGVKVKVETKGELTAGGSGGFNANLEVGPDKIASKGEVEVFFGLKLQGEVSSTLDLKEHVGLAIKGTLSGEVSAGAGGKAEYNIKLGWAGIKLSGGAAAALGLGVGGKGAVDIDTSVLLLGIDLDKVGLQEKRNEILADLLQDVKKNDLSLPSDQKWGDILPELRDKATWLAEHPELLKKNEKGSDLLIATITFQSKEEKKKSDPVCTEGTVLFALSSGENRCMPCDTLHGNFTALISKGKSKQAANILDLSVSCSWAADAQKELNKAKPCPANTVKLSDENNKNQCVPCNELRGDFNAALAGDNHGYAQTLLDLAPDCGWTAAGQKDLNRSKPCPANTVKLSDENNKNQCVPCDELRGDFDAALAGDDHGNAQTLLDLAPDCGWTAAGQKDLNRSKPCPANTVKLSDENNENQCVPCDELHSNFNAAVADGDSAYAKTLAGLGSSCGWASFAVQQLNNTNKQTELDQKCNQKLPGSHAVINEGRYTCYCNAGMLQFNGSNGSSCQSCEHVRGLVNAALQRNDINNVRGLMAGAQSCSWYDKAVQLVANIEKNSNQQAELDQRCQKQILFSHAVITGNQYRCACNNGRLIVNNSNSSACQSCEQVRVMINAALQRNDINSAAGLLGGAQNCNWYNNAAQVVANAREKGQQQDFRNLIHSIEGLTGEIIDGHNKHKKKDPPPRTHHPPKKSLPPPKKAPPKQKPTKKHSSWSLKLPDCPQHGPKSSITHTKTSRCTYDKYGYLKNAYRKQ